MQESLALSALLMGLAGGPHCVAMCGAACVALSGDADGGSSAITWSQPGESSSIEAARPRAWPFLLARMASYAALGAAAASSMQGVAWLSTQSAALRPVWVLAHVLIVFLGLVLLWQAQQPVWLEQVGRRLWSRVRSSPGLTSLPPWSLGFAWALLPCGLLYSAVMLAALGNSALDGALVMVLFAAGSSASLLAGPWLWRRLRGPAAGGWGVRLSGLMLVLTSGWALWMGMVHNQAPWCLTPSV